MVLNFLAPFKVFLNKTFWRGDFIVKRMIESTMQRAILVIICIVLILAWGGFSAFQMQRDYLPGINNTTLLVSLHATAYQADQMKKVRIMVIFQLM
jgi:Cu/Ag efflux pump CusA